MRQWRTVLALNILVSTINGNGHPNFSWKPSTQPGEPTQHSLLKYIVAMLVRNTEIVAAMAHKPKHFTNAQSKGLHVNIMGAKSPAAPLQPSGLASRMGRNDQDMFSPTAFTAVANPHTVRPPPGTGPHTRKTPQQDPYFATVSSDIDCLIVSGKSHIFDSSSDATLWARILKIP